MNLRLATQIASLAVTEAALNDPLSGRSAGTKESNRSGVPEQLPLHVGEPGLPTLPAQLIATRASRGNNELGMPPEDWFESSLPAEYLSGTAVRESSLPAQLIHTNLIHAGLKALDEGLSPGATTPGQPLSIYDVNSRTLPLQHLTSPETAEAVAAKASLEWNQSERSETKLDDQLMREIPLLFAQLPVEPLEGSTGVPLKVVVLNGMLMLGAVLAVILVTTLDLKNLLGIQMAVLAAVGTIYLILRWARLHRR